MLSKAMLSKTSFAVLIAAAIFGAASGAQAGGSKNDASSHGGYDFGPLGQCFVPPDCDQGRDQQVIGGYGYGRRAHGYAGQYPRRWHYR